jgi:predicted RNase H-like HicB family nuclease
MRYSVLLTPDPDEGGYVVTVPVLPGCVTQGETVEEALARAKDVIAGMIGLLRDEGEEIPVERDAPFVIPVDVDVPTAV